MERLSILFSPGLSIGGKLALKVTVIIDHAKVMTKRIARIASWM